VLERSTLGGDVPARTSAAYAPARTPAEKALAEVWTEVLRVPQVGIHDNFFALGGDSLLSMQMISRARQAGWQLDVQQVLERPTIAGLAPLARRSAPVRTRQDVVTGPVPLTPRQLRWFERVHPDDLHVADVARLLTKQHVDPALLDKAVRAVLMQHDALRMRFEKADAGWRQFNAPDEDQPVFSYADVSELSDSDQRQAVSDAAAELRYGLDIVRGPLMRVSLLDRGPAVPGMVLATWNHLVFDAFSLRIIFEDLEKAYHQLASGGEVELGPKTTSFKAWAERLEQYAGSGEVLDELPYWSDDARAAAAPVPVDGPPNEYGGSHLVSLDEEETDILLHRVPGTWGVEINDVLLTALLQALTPWTGRRSLMVDLVSHGRAPLFPDIDLSRTVGYLAAHFPMLLDLGDTSGSVAELMAVREQLRQIPRGGIGYGVLRYLCQDEEAVRPLVRLPEPQVMFKYDGQFDQTFADSTLFDLGPSSQLSRVDPYELGGQHLMVNPRVIQGRMQVVVRSGVVVHQRSTVERLSEDYLAALRRIIASS
jgi:non-ribosomal peptide synthase protein (TIGR01720 family)